MKHETVKIGELNFDFIPKSSEDGLPVLEIENDASMIFLRVTKEEARRLRDLLNRYIEYVPPVELSP